jgi:hypothetical protein
MSVFDVLQPDGQGAAYPGQDVPGNGDSRLERQLGRGPNQYSGHKHSTAVLCSVQDPGSSAFLPPGSDIWIQEEHLGSYSEILVTIFGVQKYLL